MQSKLKKFELQTVFPGRCIERFQVEYRLFETGKKSLSSLWKLDANGMPELPIDIMQLAANSNVFNQHLYTEVLSAMDNNAANVMEEEKPFVGDAIPFAAKAINNIFSQFKIG